MKRKPCPNKKDNENACPCPFPECPRHGICCECLQYHKTIEFPTACTKGFKNGFTDEEMEEVLDKEDLEY
ncbi:MAG: hypothetical protein QXP53_02570 [Candidatus Pacearchaeota archaeon]